MQYSSEDLVIPPVCRILKRITGNLISRTKWLYGRTGGDPLLTRLLGIKAALLLSPKQYNYYDLQIMTYLP